MSLDYFSRNEISNELSFLTMKSLKISSKLEIETNRYFPFAIIPLDKTWTEETNLESRFEKRSKIRKFGCKYLPIIANLMDKNNSDSDLLTIEEELSILTSFHSGKSNYSIDFVGLFLKKFCPRNKA